MVSLLLRKTSPGLILYCPTSRSTAALYRLPDGNDLQFRPSDIKTMSFIAMKEQRRPSAAVALGQRSFYE
jgi:hypothetical protein